MIVRLSKGNPARLAAARCAGKVNWWLNPTPQPSFMHFYSSQRRKYLHALEVTGRRWGHLWEWETKLGVRDVAAHIGVRTPRILLGPMNSSELDFSSLPHHFCIKSDLGSSKKGVFVLSRQGKGWRDLLRGGRFVTQEQVLLEIQELGSRGVIDPDRVFVEEALLRDGRALAFDWKVYAFQGQAGLVWQISRTPERRLSKYYDENWQDLGQVRWSKPATPSLPIPGLSTELLEAARKASLAVPVPFVRVDLYEHEGSVYLGELTPMPGSAQRFRHDVDFALGLAWEAADGVLMARTRSNWLA